jgi:hypothetical protein
MTRNRRSTAVPGLGERLGAIIDEDYGGKPYRLAKAMGDVERFKNRVSYWRDGLEQMGADMLQLVCQTTGASANYLLFGELPKHRREMRESQDVAEQVGGLLARKIAAALTTEGVRADEVEVDVEQVLQDTADRIATELRQSLQRQEDAIVVARHAAALGFLVSTLGGYYSAPHKNRLVEIVEQFAPPGDVSGEIGDDAGYLKALWARYEQILAYANARQYDIENFVRSLVSSVNGVSIDRYWKRRGAAGQMPSQSTEVHAIANLIADERRGTAYLNPVNPSNSDWTRAMRESWAKRWLFKAGKRQLKKKSTAGRKKRKR